MSLPVSMEDVQLFPPDKILIARADPKGIDLDNFREMRAKLSRLWWSRLIIAARGYVVNYVAHDEPVLFATDDAFIALHKHLVCEQPSEDQQKSSSSSTFADSPAVPAGKEDPGLSFIQDLFAVTTTPNVSEKLEIMARTGRPTPGDPSPWEDPKTSAAYTRIFGKPAPETFGLGNAQKLAYFVFSRILRTLDARWAESKAGQRKGIRFETDPEWHPDDRVVLFQQFYEGNRTWVLLDFDRHVLAAWRPHGAAVVFGDRFVEKKKRLGYALCSYCGMVEQRPGQFPARQGRTFCSQECHDADGR